tara:strand:- start:161 stop:403 length:243 start_codon:yes stop_codon:yes gene_type:complete
MKKHNIDSLAIMEESELRSLFFSVKSIIDRKRDRRQPVDRLEEDLCYIQRELEIRRNRVKAHKEYVSVLNHEKKNRRRRF